MIKSKLHKPIQASPVVWRIPIQILLLALSTELTLTLWYCIQFGKANDLGEWLQQNGVVAMKTFIPKLSLLQPYAEIACKIKKQMKNSTATADVSDTSDKYCY